MKTTVRFSMWTTGRILLKLVDESPLIPRSGDEVVIEDELYCVLRVRLNYRIEVNHGEVTANHCDVDVKLGSP